MKVAPFEVEAVLNSHPAVNESAVLGVADETYGEVVKAYVKLNPSAGMVTERELVKYLGGRLMNFQTPKSIKFIEDFPRNNMGKVDKKALRDTENGFVSDFVFPPLRPRDHPPARSWIVATGAYLPPDIVTNADIIAAGGLSLAEGVIRKSLGVGRRHVAAEGITDSASPLRSGTALSSGCAVCASISSPASWSPGSLAITSCP